MIINLAVNAADAMPEGGSLVIRSGADDAQQVWLSLSDSGHGIPEAIRDHIFEPFDVLLTDLMLPDATGPRLAQSLLARWPELKVILMSGYPEDEAVRSGVSGGTVRFLQKPFGADVLEREVRAALDESPAAGGA